MAIMMLSRLASLRFPAISGEVGDGDYDAIEFSLRFSLRAFRRAARKMNTAFYFMQFVLSSGHASLRKPFRNIMRYRQTSFTAASPPEPGAGCRHRLY